MASLTVFLIVQWRRRALADVRPAKKLCLGLGVWHFPVFDRWACHWLLHSGRVLLPLSPRTRQDGEVSTSLSTIIRHSTSPSLKTLYYIVWWRRPQSAGKVPIINMKEVYIKLLYAATGVFTLGLWCVITITDYIEYGNSDWMQDFNTAHVSF